MFPVSFDSSAAAADARTTSYDRPFPGNVPLGGMQQQSSALTNQAAAGRPSNATAMVSYDQSFQSFMQTAQHPQQQQHLVFNTPLGGNFHPSSGLPFQPDWSAFGDLSGGGAPSTQSAAQESFYGQLALQPSAEPVRPSTTATTTDLFGQPAPAEQQPHAFFRPPVPLHQQQQHANIPQPQALLPVPPQIDVENDAVLKALRDELEEINREVSELQERHTKTQRDILEKEQAVLLSHQNVAATQSEVSSLKSAMKQLDMQKEAAHRKLLDLEAEKTQLEVSVKNLRDELTGEEADVKQLRSLVDDSTKNLKNQEVEFHRKREELAELTAQEAVLHQKLESSRTQLANLDNALQEGTTKLSSFEDQVVRARSLNTALEEAIKRFDAAMGKLDAAEEKSQDSSAPSTELPQLDETTEKDLATPAERLSFSAAGLKLGSFSLIDPFESTAAFSVARVPFSNANTNDNSFGSFGAVPAASAAGFASDPFASSSVATTSRSAVTTDTWSAFAGGSAFPSSDVNNASFTEKKNPPPRPPAMSVMPHTATGPAGFWSAAEFDPFSSVSNSTNNNKQPSTESSAMSPHYFRGGSGANDLSSFPTADFMPASRTGPQHNVFGGEDLANKFDAWDAFAQTSSSKQ